MFYLNKKLLGTLKRKEKKKKPQETKQLLEPAEDMSQMLEVSDREFKITMIK